jgi:hypothetical protein
MDTSIGTQIICRSQTQGTHGREGKFEQASIIAPQPINSYVSKGGTIFMDALMGIRIMLYWGIHVLVN